jgi:type I restriction enzyme S subunit
MPGKYQAYAEYKNSGVEWIDSIPNHWGKVNMRWLVQLYAGGTPSKNVEEYWEEGTVPWINSGAVNQITVTEPSLYITEQAYENSSAKWIPKNALVMALAGQGKTKGMVAKLAIDTTCNQSMAAIVPNKLSDSRYLFWWLTFNYQNIRNMAGGDLRDGLNLELLGNIGCPIPTDMEKDCIANFLDHETAKIDTLIEKQQQLIQLLKEKRQAVISHAVTKGLNPNARMRDSGVEWLGEVPVHWDVKRFKFLCDLIIAGPFGSSLTKDMYVKDGYKVYGQEQVIPNDFSIGDYYISEKDYMDMSRYRVFPFDILISCVGTFGKIAVFPADAENGIINPRLIKASINKICNPYYIREMLKSEMVYKQFELLSRGGTMGVINIAILNEILTVVPPIQ